MKLSPRPFTLRQLQYAVAVADTLSFRARRRALPRVPALAERPARPARARRSGVAPVRARPAAGAADRRRARAGRARPRRAAGGGRPGRGGARARAIRCAGTLRIGVIPTISPYLLPTVAPALRARYPRLTCVWRGGQDGRPRARARRPARSTPRCSRWRPTSATSSARSSHATRSSWPRRRGHPLGAPAPRRWRRRSCATSRCSCSTTGTASATRRWRSAARRGCARS